MYYLALHTTTPQLGISISNFKDDTRSQVWDLHHDVSNYLHQYLQEFITPQTWQDIGFIAVAKGPGGFTGSRIGVVTARTIGQQLNIPVFGISTLAAIIWSEIQPIPDSIIAIQMEARRGELFVAIYQVNSDGLGLKPYLADTTMTPEAWSQSLNNIKTSYQLIKSPPNIGNTVSSVLLMAYFDWQQGKRPHWSEIIPFYGHHPVVAKK